MMPPLTDTQYRVLGDLVAGRDLRCTIYPWNKQSRWNIANRRIPQYDAQTLLDAEWVVLHTADRLSSNYRITAAGRAAYAQAQARRAAQEAAG